MAIQTGTPETQPHASPDRDRKTSLRTITLEEHFSTPSFMDRQAQQRGSGALTGLLPSHIDELLCDLGHGRIELMNAAGIDVQVLSLTSPGAEGFEANDAIAIASETNDALAEAIRRFPSRLQGFASLPTVIPQRAAEELESRVKTQGFRGAVINGHCQGRYLDDPFFWPIFERAEALEVPIYLHPTQPPQAVLDAYYNGFDPKVSFLFANAGWGWHIETGVHVLRLVLGGVFDRFPRLQLVIGHLGEGLPFMIERFKMLRPDLTGLKRPVSAYLRENLSYTISGFNFTPTFMDLLMEVGADRIMFSADHPYASMQAARVFLDGLPVSPSDRAKIAHGNAERLLGI
jgi:predicted TIM-barrel fold metal-dependent hydrolase